MKYLITIIFLLFPIMLFSQEGIILDKIEFFEAGYEVPKENVIYANDFSQENSRYIWTRVIVENLLYKKSDHTHTVFFRYFNPSDSLIAEFTSNMNVKREWENAYTSRGWGWEIPGNWKPGIYWVEVYIDDIFVGDKQFLIIEQKFLQKGPKTIMFNGMNFWEGSYNEKLSEKTVYSNQFLKSETRFIYTTLEVKNFLYNIDDNIVNIYLKYYTPDGILWGVPKISVILDKEWEYADIYNGYGFEEPGNFKPGKYMVEAYYRGELFVTGYFTIIDD